MGSESWVLQSGGQSATTKRASSSTAAMGLLTQCGHLVVRRGHHCWLSDARLDPCGLWVRVRGSCNNLSELPVPPSSHPVFYLLHFFPVGSQDHCLHLSTTPLLKPPGFLDLNRFLLSVWKSRYCYLHVVTKTNLCKLTGLSVLRK